jgi:hypothetical protein
MSISNKTPSVQAYKLLVYQRALHPELFGILDRRTVTQTNYEMESWITRGGHVMRFQAGGDCVTEAVLGQDLSLPQRGLLHTVPCLGEKEMDEVIEDSVRYVASVQTELLSDNLYQATLAELTEFASETDAMVHAWTDPDGSQNLSILDVQRYKKEIHAQSYHLIGSAGFVLRTQTIFELV